MFNLIRTRMSKILKILSIDGGGMKAYHTLILLSEWEIKYDKTIFSTFDMICGTSTGGIIALAISLNISINELISFYEQCGPKIFYIDTWIEKIIGMIRQVLTSTKYDSTLYKHCKPIFKNHKLNNIKSLVCIPTFNMNDGDILVFKRPHDDMNNEFNSVNVLDVIMSTSAAPTYFPIHHIKTGSITGDFVDGGMWANNPSLYGIHEAFNYINDKYGYTGYEILSLPTLSAPYKPVKEYKKHNKSVLNWGSNLFSVFLESQADCTTLYAKNISKITGNKYYRFKPMTIPYNKTSLIQLDNATPKALAYMKKLALIDVSYEDKEIDHFFSTNKTFIL
jgi:hypothetical protein